MSDDADKPKGWVVEQVESVSIANPRVFTIKQVLVVRKDLNMRKGKIAAQCAHASMKVLLDLMTKDVYAHESEDPSLSLTKTTYSFAAKHGTPLHLWLEGSFAKVCVSVNSEAELDAVYAKAQEAKLLCAMIIDSGRTEFHGQPTKTVVAIGPDYGSEIDPITGHLPLL
jgi:PTH2 family peptidyl-tRNA hydrolase